MFFLMWSWACCYIHVFSYEHMTAFGVNAFKTTESWICFSVTNLIFLDKACDSYFSIMLSNFTSEGGWNRKVSLQNSKHLRAQHQNWTWASKRGRPSRSASEWVFSSGISHVNNLWYNTFLIVDMLMFDCRIAWWEMQVIKQAFPKLINLL